MQTPVPAAFVPPQAFTSRRSQAMWQTARFGIAVPVWSFICSQPPDFGAVHALPAFAQKAWQAP